MVSAPRDFSIALAQVNIEEALIQFQKIAPDYGLLTLRYWLQNPSEIRVKRPEDREVARMAALANIAYLTADPSGASFDGSPKAKGKICLHAEFGRHRGFALTLINKMIEETGEAFNERPNEWGSW